MGSSARSVHVVLSELPAKEVERIGQRLQTLDFDALYSAFWDRGDIEQDAKAAVARSVERHVRGPDASEEV